MDTAPATQALILPFPNAQQTKPGVAKDTLDLPPPEVVAAWPRSAQFAGVFILGALTALLAVHALTYLRSGAEPSAIENPHPITYRVDLNEARKAELVHLPGV